MVAIKFSSPTGIIHLAFAVMWIVITVILVPSAVFAFFTRLPWVGLILLALAAFCVWQFRVFLRDGLAERRAYRADLAVEAAKPAHRN